MPQERALGIQWNVERDCFRFDNTLKDQPATRRGILSTVASIYDPLGFLAPYVLHGKRTEALRPRDNQVSLKCDTNVLALGMNIKNKAEVSAGSGAVKFKTETKADRNENQIYSLLTALLDVNGLIMNSNANVTLLENNAAHKASLTFDKDGLVASSTNSLHGPFTMENTFNAGLDASRATLSMESKSAFNDIKVENANSLTVTLATLSFNSKAKALVSDSTSYTHDIIIDVRDHTASVSVNNDLKLLTSSLNHKAQLKAEIYKIDLTGSLQAAYDKEVLKHTYEMNYADWTANIKCGTTGKLLGAHMSHNTELEIIGLAARIQNDARFISQLLRFDNTIRASVIPFDVNFDAIFNADGDLTLYGKHSAQLYGKILLKAQPLAFGTSHECRASITQKLDNGISVETTFDNKMDTLVSPEIQELTLRVRSKVNNHALNQDIKAYNRPDMLGLELSGSLSNGDLNTAASEDQEFTISGFLKYDKNTESHIIYLPFLESLPAILQDIKNTIVNIAEALQNYMNNEMTQAKLKALTQHVNDFVAELDLEGKFVQLKRGLIIFSRDYVITLKDLEGFLVNYKTVVENLLIDILSTIQEVIDTAKAIIINGLLSEDVIQRLNERLNAINDEYEFTTNIGYVIDAIENLVKQIDMQKLKDTSLAFLLDIDAQLEIKAKIENAVSELKESFENFNGSRCIKYVRDYISAINLDANFEQFIRMTLEFVKEWIQDFQIIDSVNAFHAKLREIIERYDVDEKLDVVLEKFVELIKQVNIKETIQVLANNLFAKSVDITGKVLQTLKEAINFLKTTEISEVIDKLNVHLNSFVQKLNSFDYNAFVDEVNQCIAEYIAHVNKLIKEFEIPEKLEAVREFVNFVISSAVYFINSLRDIQVAEMITPLDDMVHHIIDLDDIVGDMKLSYLPNLPEITLPGFTLSEITFPALPKVAAEKLLKIPTLQIPTFKLPDIPSEFTLPCFGKLYSEIKVKSPMFSMTTYAELRNATEKATAPQFTVLLSSRGESPSVKILTYNLESTTRVAIAKLSRVFLAETLKFTHSALAIDHQSAVTIYSLASHGTARTMIKATTAPYNAHIVNQAHIAIGSGLSAATDTTYNHKITLPIVGFTSEASLKQKALAKIEDHTFSLLVEDNCTIKVNSEDGTHKGQLDFSISPKTARLRMTSDTDTALLKMKQSMNGVAVTLSHMTFDIRSEAEGPAIKNSLLVASGNANLRDAIVELKANHNSELVGSLSGTLSNSVILLIRPVEIVFDFQNKGNTKVNFITGVVAKVDLQNDYSATIKPEAQKINTVALVRFNQYKSSYNFTFENNKREAVLSAAVNGEANLDFLTRPVTIPEVDMFMFYSPGVRFDNLYENSGLKNILITTEQSLDVDAKITYQKRPFSYLGNLITELSLKSPMLNLNANGEVDTEKDLVFRLGATTASVFDALKAKLDCATSLTTKRGLKMATALSLANRLVSGTHDSTFSLNTDNLEAALSVDTSAKVAVYVINLEANQQLAADTKNKFNVAHTFKLKGYYDMPFFRTHCQVKAEHSLKLEGASDSFSVETSSEGIIDGSVGTQISALGALKNDAVFYINGDGLRSTLKTNVSARYTEFSNTIIEMVLVENMAVEASSKRVYAMLKLNSNNEVNLPIDRFKGRHVAQATIEFVPWKSLTSGYEIDISQQSRCADVAIFKKSNIDLKCYKQTISAITKISMPLYITEVAAHLEVAVPVVTAALKASATSVIDLLDYDTDASFTINFEKEALGLTGKVLLNHTDLTINIQNVITQALSDFRHKLDMDITSPIFTDVNFRYTARTDGANISISNPSSGFLGIQLHGRSPFLLSTRLYNRYPSAPEDDVDILLISTTASDGVTTNLQVVYNRKTLDVMLFGLWTKLPVIKSILTEFVKKHPQVFQPFELLTFATIRLIEEAPYSIANNYGRNLSQLSVLYRNTVVYYLRIVPVFREAAIRIMRDPQEATKKEFVDQVYDLTHCFMDLENGITELVLYGQETVDDLKSDYLDGIAVTINRRYLNFVFEVKFFMEDVSMKPVKREIQKVIDFVWTVVSGFHRVVTNFLDQAPGRGREFAIIEIDLPFPFQQWIPSQTRPSVY
ncbi:hypothetical protein DPEC_G00319750 [Dallia pectoralis]|uniref:Uncharacterized protein n=1 Tax=Dallia pectoralis TaxID=75939 RepID=A0ACC2F9L3_DALPE|nr:hypothetical protein DPEC_G00319750 [Dallia pectoralis]